MKLPKNRYFGARYLVLKNSISYASLYEKVLIILLSIIMLVFILSLFFLRSFAKPFQEMNKQLDNFIKDSMHEINTPLSIINVNIDLYNRKNKENKYMQRMKAAAKVLSNIYNDMDYLIKYDKVEYEKSKIDLKIFLAERIEYFQEVAKMKNIEITYKLCEGYIININNKELRRIIDNTISNAIKYSYENTTIDITLFMQDSKCHMSFRDYGMGIQKTDKIFSRYYREDRSKGGFGIGLNIVKNIIEKYNIELKIDSQPKQGSTFIYIFPHESPQEI